MRMVIGDVRHPEVLCDASRRGVVGVDDRGEKRRRELVPDEL
ncbi:hypothetical protein [Microbacterium sp. KHB019]